MQIYFLKVLFYAVRRFYFRGKKIIQFFFDGNVQRLDKFFFGAKIMEKRSVGNTRFFGNFACRRTVETKLHKKRESTVKNLLLFVH